MIFIILAYILAQAGATLFLFFQIHSEDFIDHLVFAAPAVLFYLATHFKQPGYANSEKLQLYSQKSVDLSDSIQQTSSQIQTPKKRPIQTKFCTICKQDQLLRMKHCYDCNLCVATFDHHCVWVDNCIGEKNRPLFYLFLWSNMLEIGNGFSSLILSMYRQGSWFPYQIVFLSIVGVIGSGVAILLVLHSYLMAVNLTTCTFRDYSGESIRWEKIYYLIGLKKSNGSPFNKGIIINVIEYWKISFQRRLKDWRFDDAAVIQTLNKDSLPEEKN